MDWFSSSNEDGMLRRALEQQHAQATGIRTELETTNDRLRKIRSELIFVGIAVVALGFALLVLNQTVRRK